MKKKFFVMLYHPSGRPVPVTEGNDDEMYGDSVAMFATAKEAHDCMKDHDAAQAWGYGVFNIYQTYETIY